MNESAPERGAGSDAPTERVSVCGRMVGTSGGLLERGSVRTSFSNAHRNQSNATRRECSIGGFCLFQALRLVNCSGENNYPAAVGRFQNHPVAVCRSLVSPEQLTYGKSERDLDLPEPRGSGEGRASGKREERQRRPRTTPGGAEAVPSAGWRSVAEALDASGGMRP